ncbi:hypothetical protein BJY04DRAFT_157090 [Aspergillus karnatakaensis]|uniref:uncharacterized protein n=1 Tax=Aspergillus karnatakaensis TaxID=1810916 RepID=UPI003CCD2169
MQACRDISSILKPETSRHENKESIGEANALCRPRRQNEIRPADSGSLHELASPDYKAAELQDTTFHGSQEQILPRYGLASQFIKLESNLPRSAAARPVIENDTQAPRVTPRGRRSDLLYHRHELALVDESAAMSAKNKTAVIKEPAMTLRDYTKARLPKQSR